MFDMVKDLRIAKGDIVTREQVVEWFSARYPKFKKGTITAHLIRMSTNAKSRIHHYRTTMNDDLFYQIDPSRFELYDSTKHPAPIVPDMDSQDAAPSGEEEQSANSPESQGPSEFAYERDLQNFLAKHLDRIEPGMKLYEAEGISGVEFPVGGRSIDLLACGSDDSLVVIELKVSRGYDRVVGQLLRYMAWVRENVAEDGQRVRGIIIARTISEDLRLAASALPDVQLLEYEISVSIRALMKR